MVELKVSFFRSHVSLHDLSSNVQDTAKVRQVTGVLYEPHVVKEGIRKIQLIGRDSKFQIRHTLIGENLREYDSTKPNADPPKRHQTKHGKSLEVEMDSGQVRFQWLRCRILQRK